VVSALYKFNRFQKARNPTVHVRAERYEAEDDDRVATDSRHQQQKVYSVRKVSQEKEADDEHTLYEERSDDRQFEITLTPIDAGQCRRPHFIKLYRLCHFKSPFHNLLVCIM